MTTLLEPHATPAQAINALLAALGARTDAAAVRWTPAPAWPVPGVPAATWIAPGQARTAPTRGPAVRLTSDVTVGALSAGMVALLPPAGRGTTNEHQELLGITADCIGFVLRSALLDEQASSWAQRLRAAQAQLSQARPRLAAARADERMRLVRSVLSMADGPLTPLLESVDELVESLRRDPAASRTALDLAAALVEQLIDQLRRLARGAYPVVLRTHGPVAALQELADELRHLVTFHGETHLRAGWEVESALYWAVCAILLELESWSTEQPIRVQWNRSGPMLLAAISVAPDGGPNTRANRELVSGLLADTRRLEALGGSMALRTDGPNTVITCSLPDSVHPGAVG